MNRHNPTKILSAIREAQAIQAGTIVNRSKPFLPSKNGVSLFGNTAELRATIAKIRTIEASKPSVAKFPQPKFDAANPFCKKKDVLEATAHLAKIQGLTPTATAKAPTSRAKAPTAAVPTLRQRINSEPCAAKRQQLRNQNWKKLCTK
jgi:hypothetical protein